MTTTNGHVLQWIAMSLLGVAIIMTNSAGMSVGGEPVSAMTFLTGRATIYALVAIAAMAAASYLDIRRLYQGRGMRNLMVWFWLLAIVLCALALVPGLGRNVNGASRWLNLGPASWGLSFQPSELAKWATVAAIAWWGARRSGAMHKFFHGVMPPLIGLGVVCGLIILEDLGTAVLIGAVGVLMLIAAGARIWQMALLAPAALAGVVAMIIISPYRMRRLVAFLDPWADPQGVGYHPIQSLIAIAGGEVTGRGMGNGLQKFGYLPEDTTDFIFAVICEELGIAGAVLVVGMYVALLWVGMSVVAECRHAFGRLLALGILATIGMQAVINIAVVTVVVPTKGIALPLLSYGGTGWVLCAGAVGLLAAIDRLNRVEALEGEDQLGQVPVVPTPAA